MTWSSNEREKTDKYMAKDNKLILFYKPINSTPCTLNSNLSLSAYNKLFPFSSKMRMRLLFMTTSSLPTWIWPVSLLLASLADNVTFLVDWMFSAESLEKENNKWFERHHMEIIYSKWAELADWMGYFPGQLSNFCKIKSGRHVPYNIV